jgi:EpsI family protein
MKAQWRYLTVYLLLGLAALFIQTHATHAVPVAQPLTGIPTQLGEWKMIRQTEFSPKVLAGLRPTDYLFREYVDSQGRNLSLYIGYHDGGPDSGPIHSPKHCLPGSGWHAVAEQTTQLAIAGEQLKVVQSLYAKGSSQEFFVYWYQVKGEVLTNEYALKIAEIRNAMLHRRKDSAFIRISVPDAANIADPASLAGDFITRVFPHIQAALPL